MVIADGIELEVEGLTRRYSPQVTVGPISFDVRTGEFFSLLGPSGCGKTTTLRCIAGLSYGAFPSSKLPSGSGVSCGWSISRRSPSAFRHSFRAGSNSGLQSPAR